MRFCKLLSLKFSHNKKHNDLNAFATSFQNAAVKAAVKNNSAFANYIAEYMKMKEMTNSIQRFSYHCLSN